jgi:hemolysin III
MGRVSKQEQKAAKKVARQAKRLAKKAEYIKIKHQWKTLPKAQRPKQFSSDFLHRWNVHEEVANSITHGIGVLLGIAALVLMIVDAASHGSVTGVVSGAVFGTSIIIAYISSMIYHAVFYPPVKQFFKIMDHSSIFLLIAGTYTPFALITLHGALGWTLFGVAWGIATVGIILKFSYVDDFTTLSTALYLLMGWMAAGLMVQLIQHLAFGGIVWLAIGGLCYTLGIVFFIYERIPFFHTIWHLFVLAGTISHFFAILLYVMPVVV